LHPSVSRTASVATVTAQFAWFMGTLVQRRENALPAIAADRHNQAIETFPSTNRVGKDFALDTVGLVSCGNRGQSATNNLRSAKAADRECHNENKILVSVLIAGLVHSIDLIRGLDYDKFSLKILPITEQL